MIASIAETVVVPLFLGSLLLLVTAPVGLWFTLLVFGLFILNPIFGILLRQPTLEGKRLLNEIHSFKSFLREEARRTEGRRDRSPEEGDTLFPYAVAFGFSSDWLRAFQHQISKMESFGGIDRAFFQNSSRINLFEMVRLAQILEFGIDSAVNEGERITGVGGTAAGSSGGGGARGGGGGFSAGGGGGGW